VPSEENVVGVKIGIIAALQLLQSRLGETQEGMASRLGCTFSAYSKWLRGVNIPAGEWMLRILALCPDRETYDAFFVDIGQVGSKMAASPQPEVPIEKDEVRPGAMNSRGRITPKHYKAGPKGR